MLVFLKIFRKTNIFYPLIRGTTGHTQAEVTVSDTSSISN